MYKDYNEFMLNKPWKIYFSRLKVFGRTEWTEPFEAIGTGIFYLGAGILMLFWLFVRVAIYPIYRAAMVYKFHKRAKWRQAKKKKSNIFDDMGHV